MKYLFYFLTLFVLFSCSIDEKTGLISISNLTNNNINNIYIGNNFIVNLQKGGKYDYWFYKEINNKISANGVDEVWVITSEINSNNYNIWKEDAICNFKTSYIYDIRILKRSNGKIYCDVNIGRKVGSNTDDDDFYSYPSQ